MGKMIVAIDGPLDGLVYAAGVGTALPLMQSKPEKVQDTFNVNFFGFFEVIRPVGTTGQSRKNLQKKEFALILWRRP